MQYAARPKLALRRFRPSDAAFVRALSQAAFSEYASDAAERSTRSGTTVVATLGERAVGFFTLRVTGGSAHLVAIAVVERERGHGVGRSLLRAAEREAGRAGARAMELATAESNLAALQLFLASGYRIERTVPRYYPRGQAAHLLEKRL